MLKTVCTVMSRLECFGTWSIIAKAIFVLVAVPIDAERILGLRGKIAIKEYPLKIKVVKGHRLKKDQPPPAWASFSRSICPGFHFVNDTACVSAMVL